VTTIIIGTLPLPSRQAKDVETRRDGSTQDLRREIVRKRNEDAAAIVVMRAGTVVSVMCSNETVKETHVRETAIESVTGTAVATVITNRRVENLLVIVNATVIIATRRTTIAVVATETTTTTTMGNHAISAADTYLISLQISH